MRYHVLDKDDRDILDKNSEKCKKILNETIKD